MTELTYRPERRGLACGAIAVMLHATSWWSVARFLEERAPAGWIETLASWSGWLSNAGVLVAVAGIAYSAIAGHHRRWGPTLVIAWILNVTAAFGAPQPFFFAKF